MLEQSNRVEIATLVVKVASRCNLDCDYCYVYHGQDDSWRSMPSVMPDPVLGAIPAQLLSLSKKQKKPPTVVLHGGEPLLLGHRKIRKLVEECVALVPDAVISIQSNGTVYTTELEKLFQEFKRNLVFSLSIDGDKTAQDRHRRSLLGASVFTRVSKNAQLANKAGVLSQVLIVVDERNTPESIMNFMKAVGAPSYNLLLMDGDYDAPPPTKSDLVSTETGAWLWGLFALYASQKNGFKIKFFDDIAIALLKQARKILVPKPNFSLCTMTVDTNGEIKQVDTLRTNAGSTDRLGGYNILDTDLGEVANSQENLASLSRTERLCSACLECQFLDVCGGGYPPHRAKQGSYENPSIYCSDYKYLFERMREKLCT